MPAHAQTVQQIESESRLPSIQLPSPSTELIATVALPGNPDIHSPYPEYAIDSPPDLTPSGKADYYFRRILNPGSALGPALEAAFVMAAPPKGYPPEWHHGAGAFGRNYGAVLGRAQTGEFSRFAAGVALREDPRYYPSPIRTTARRIFYAFGFTVVDRSDSGQPRLAFANFFGSAAGGFVGDAYLPGGYTDLRHAGVRTGIEMATFAVHNIGDEFAPEWDKLARAVKLRLHLTQ